MGKVSDAWPRPRRRLDAIAGSTASTNDESEWVLTVYLIANAVFLPSSAWFAQKFGRKCFLMMSVLIFTIASFACGLATSLPLILIARMIQGRGWRSFAAALPGDPFGKLSGK